MCEKTQPTTPSGRHCRKNQRLFKQPKEPQVDELNEIHLMVETFAHPSDSDVKFHANKPWERRTSTTCCFETAIRHLSARFAPSRRQTQRRKQRQMHRLTNSYFEHSTKKRRGFQNSNKPAQHRIRKQNFFLPITRNEFNQKFQPVRRLRCVYELFVILFDIEEFGLQSSYIRTALNLTRLAKVCFRAELCLCNCWRRQRAVL